MPALGELLAEAKGTFLRTLEVSGLAWDSRRVNPGDLFFAWAGTQADGHAYLAEVAQRGAVAAVGEKVLNAPLPYLRVCDARRALAQAAAAFYGHPTRDLSTVAVTGTNGKTTVVHLLGQLLAACETITTVRVESDGLSCVTTPEAPDLHRIAARARAEGKKAFAFEASSIGLAQRRVDGVHLRAGVFLGLGRDHLDFHGTMENYRAAKLRLFELLNPESVGVVHAEDPHAPVFMKTGLGKRLTFGIRQGDVRAERLKLFPDAAQFLLLTPGGQAPVCVPFPGEHNVRNALAAAAVAWSLGQPVEAIAERLGRAELPPGRFQKLLARNGAWVVIDYAHNPQALESILCALRPQARRLLVVFGANGQADEGKRPWMGQVVGRWADLAVLTSDNPKREDPQRIAAAVAEGIRAVGGQYLLELDRARAVERAMSEARPGDVVLLAGKGHERHQLTAHGPLPYNELDVLRSGGWITS